MNRDKMRETVENVNGSGKEVESSLPDDFEGDISELIEKEESLPVSRKISYEDDDFSDGDSTYQLDESGLGFDSYDDYDYDDELDDIDDDDDDYDYDDDDDDYDDY